MFDKRTICYLDNASTSFPKPKLVYDTMDYYARNMHGSHNRSITRYSASYESIADDVREKVSNLINCKPDEIYFTSGATESLNLALIGLITHGDHIVISPWEHNSVTRPLCFLKDEKNISISICKADLENGFQAEQIHSYINSSTRLIMINHVSNVLGMISPLKEIGKIISQYPDIIFAVDASQSIGSTSIDVVEHGIDFLAFPGHKSLLGPAGIGGFYVSNKLKPILKPLKYGGTGVSSHELIFVDKGAHKYEVGTQNIHGLVGLRSALEYLFQIGIEEVQKHISQLTEYLVYRLSEINNVQTYIPVNQTPHGVISLNMAPFSPKDLALILLDEFNIITRDGMHCSIDAHKISSTHNHGSVRISLGAMTKKNDVDYLCDNLALINS